MILKCIENDAQYMVDIEIFKKFTYKYADKYEFISEQKKGEKEIFEKAKKDLKTQKLSEKDKHFLLTN